jgi:hypothetical protein
MNRNAPQVAKALIAITVAEANGTLRKKRRSMNGSWRRDSNRRNAAKASTATPAVVRTRGWPHPSAGPSIRV